MVYIIYTHRRSRRCAFAPTQGLHANLLSKLKDEVEHQKKADHIVNTVLSLLDKDGDGKITMEEFKVVGLDGLPNFEDLGAEGHHYDIESGQLEVVSCISIHHSSFWGFDRILPSS